MKISDRGFAELVSHEAIVPYVYFDSEGVLTWGIGHTASAGEPDPAKMPRGVASPISEVLAVFRRDLEKFERRVSDAVKVQLAQHEFDALVSFDFNTGGVYRADLTASLNAGNRKRAAEQFLGWLKPKKIKGRRLAEQALFRDGTYSSDGWVNVYPADAKGNVLWKRGKRVKLAALLARVGAAEPQAAPTAAPLPRPKPGAAEPARPATEPPKAAPAPSGGLDRIVNGKALFFAAVGLAIGAVVLLVLFKGA